MIIYEIIIFYILGLLIEFILSFCKRKVFTIIPVIISCIFFLITKKENCYLLAFYQIILAFMTIAVDFIVKTINHKRKNSNIDKMKIKDLI